MSRVILLRHAAAEHATGSDDERPLSEGGRKEAHEIGTWLQGIGWAPDVVVTSPALRARQTADLVMQVTGDVATRIDAALYLGEPGDYLAASRADGRCILVVGHNPLIEDAASRLAGRPLTMGTAYAACFEDGSLIHFERPHL